MEFEFKHEFYFSQIFTSKMSTFKLGLIILAHLLKSKSQKKQFFEIFRNQKLQVNATEFYHKDLQLLNTFYL